MTLHGNTHPLARPQFDRGPAGDDLPANRMMLLLARAPEQQAALDEFLQQQQTSSSPNYRHWLTPAEFGRRFGPDDADIHTIVGWLQQQGFAVSRVAAGKSVIEFSGSAGQVRQAFHATIHKYDVNGREYWANAQDPQIPAALAPVVRGLVSLNDFPRKPYSHQIGVFARDRHGAVTPEYTVSNGSGTYYALGPADFATIYNTAPLLQSGDNGAGQTIAVVGRSNINLKDIADFRNMFGLSAGNTSVVLDGPDPGIVKADEGESLLDVEWANAVAPGASVVLVSAQNTETTSGIDLAALYAVENNLAGVLSVSYGSCEANLGAAGNQYFQTLWQQAAAQGMTVLVSSGDSGSAGCDDPNTRLIAKSGLGVNGLASTAYNVAVGGTDFDDAGTQSTYWNSTNDSTTRGSAKSYIPETTWNETCAASATAANLSVCPAMPTSGPPPGSLNLWAGSGGASNCISSAMSAGVLNCQSGATKPSWQTGSGVPSDGVRDIPDVSLFAAANSASKSFYVVCQGDEVPLAYNSCQPSSGNVYFLAVGGTSAAAPSFAGIVALAEQKAGTRLGNLNYLLYSLAARSGASCTSAASPGAACIFNDVVKGNISVPCVGNTPNCSQLNDTFTGVIIDASRSPAYLAGASYDLATGLGSVNAANLVSAIAAAEGGVTPTTTALTLNGGTTELTAQHGDVINVGVSVDPSASTGNVSLFGNSKPIDANSLSSGVASWASKLFPGGTYTVDAHYAGDGTHGASDSNGISVTINPESSRTFVNLVTFDLKGALQSFTANTAPYGSPYVLRLDVTDAAASVSSTQGVSSKCSAGDASCPTGALTLTANGSPLDGGSFRLNSKGFTEDQAIQLPAGTYTVAASYQGDSSYGASTASSLFSISKAQTTLTAGSLIVPPFQYGSPVQIGAEVGTTSSGVGPTGSITFFDNNVPAGSSVHNSSQNSSSGSATGSARLTYSGMYAPPSLGTHSLYAQFAGDSNYTSSTSSSFSFTVVKATTWVSGYSTPPTAATPTIPVTFFLDIGSPSQLDQPTGTVTFYDNGTPISGTVTYGGHAGSWNATAGGNYIAVLTSQLATTFSQLGNHAITATYSGDDKYTTVTQNLGTLTVYDKLPTTVTVMAGMSPALLNYPTNMSVSVGTSVWSGVPSMTGTVTFYDNGQPLSGNVTYSMEGTVIRASLPYSFTSTGAHSITASYSGDANYASSSVTTPLSLTVVDKLTTTIPDLNVYNRAANQPTSLMTDVSSGAVYTGPVMTGSVTFLDNDSPMAGAVSLTSLSGYIIASMPYTFTTTGTHNITVQYSGDAHYAASQSKVFPIDILGPLAVRVVNGNQLLGPSGGASTAYLDLYNNTTTAMVVTLTCKPDSSSATCSVDPSTVTVPANVMNTPTVTFRVPALTAGVHQRIPFTTTFAFTAVIFGLAFTVRKKHAYTLALIMAAALAISMAACGGGNKSGSSTPPSPPPSSAPTSKTYNFTITAISGTYTDTQVLTVTVK